MKIYSSEETAEIYRRFLKKCAESETTWTNPYTGETTPCLEWQGSVNSQGYGRFWLDGKNQKAHRVSFIFILGGCEIGSWPVVVPHHLCGNKKCQRHLVLLSQRDNIRVIRKPWILKPLLKNLGFAERKVL